MKKMILESVKDTEDIHSLLTMIQEENTLAFNMFYEMYYDQVFRYTYYFLKDTESCREVVADVFFAVWQSRKRLKDIENLEAYLFISVRNEVTRYNKKNGRQNRVSLEQLLGKIIGELPEKCRLIFLMARQEQLKPKEIAERLCISENTVRVQMKIAIEKIIKQIKPYYPDLTLSLLWSFFFSSIS